MNFDYVVFGGKERVQLSNYVEGSTIRAEEAAKAAVDKTRGQIAPASKTALQQLPPAKGNVIYKGQFLSHSGGITAKPRTSHFVLAQVMVIGFLEKAVAVLVFRVVGEVCTERRA